jgi:hypothetical protein
MASSCAHARPTPSIVRQGVNHSRPAVSVPARASTPSDATSTAFGANSDGIHQAMERAVALDQVRALGPREFAEGVLQRPDRQHRVEPGERVAQPLRQHHLAVVGALGRGHVGRDLRAVRDLPAAGLQPGEGGRFDIGFGEGGAHALSQSARIGTANSESPKLILAEPS